MVMPNNNRSGLDNLASAITWAIIATAVTHFLQKYPAFRVVMAIAFVVFGRAFIAADGSAGVAVGIICFVIAALLVVWAHKPIRNRQAASARFAALQTPEDVSKLMTGTPVRSGPLVGWAIQVAQRPQSTTVPLDGKGKVYGRPLTATSREGAAHVMAASSS